MSEPQPNEPLSLDVFDSTPLFMRKIPSGDDDTSESNTLAALQSLIHDEPPEEVAANFKDQGNEYFKGRRFREALGFYTQGIDALTIRPVEDEQGAVQRIPVQEKDKPLYNTLLLNRAAANLELENFGRVLKDVHIILECDPRSSKALFRAARALIKLGRPEEAVDACDRCLAFDPNNNDVKKIKETAAKNIEEEARRTLAKVQAAERAKLERAALEAALNHHGITVLASENKVEPESLPHLDPPLPTDPMAAELVCRVALIYPQHGQTDLIVRFSTHDTLGAHLDAILPDPTSPDGQADYPSWDTEKEYSSHVVNVYARTRRGRVLKLGRNKTLADICAHVRTTGKAKGTEDGLVVGQGVIAFVVVPRNSRAEEKYLKSIKEERSTP